MLNRLFSAPRMCRAALALSLLSCLFSPALHAQEYYVVPWLIVETYYDDNALFNPDTQEQTSDIVLRVSPRLDVGYISGTLNWELSYRNDAEWYRDLSYLDSTTARGFGRGTINYTPNRRLSMNGAVDYVKTNSAEDITLIPGEDIPGRFGRADAERFGVSGGVDYLFTQNLTGSVDVRWVRDELIDVSDSDNFNVVALLEQSLARNRSLLYGYRYRDYEFNRRINTDPVQNLTTTADSHTPWIGYTHRVSEISDFELRAGPRFSDAEFAGSEVDPYLLARWSRQYDRGDFSVTAQWDETTVLAETGPVDSKSIRAGWNHVFTESFDAGSTATYAQVSGTGYEADTASFGVFANYRFNRYVYLTGRYRFSVQDVDRDPLSNRRIDRNLISVAITFTRPRSGA